ncbi:hypothetical protein HPB48_017914 [Haemaphysalis longicornis]|uniref:Disease resistance R13L4/SHOC-2-like LRR domain-containing protein n=1 Tax=Haemaphysalis longicornis TaxID=44386 RepID=A0A9J6GSE4_HAELO|nr:hypothetical protein HPB48_017914 [Haemaphysalis longicornis]
MAPAWQEVDHARIEKRCELVLSGATISKRIEEEAFDDSLFTLFHLNFLEISHTCLTSMPPGIARLVNLTRLVLSANQLSMLPPDMGKLRKLKFLDASRNAIEELPVELSNLTELQCLNVSNNKLSSIPDEFSKLSRLIVLNFSHNDIVEFPSFLSGEAKFENMSEVVASNNRIETLPGKLSHTLPSIKLLDVAGNQLKQVPGELGDIGKLKEIQLKENPLSDKRLKKLVEQCHYKQVLEYIKSHGPRDTSAQSHDKSGSAKKGGKKKGPVIASGVQELQNAFEVLQLNTQSPTVIVSDAVQEVRPYIVCCIMRNVYLDRDNRLRKFLALQVAPVVDSHVYPEFKDEQSVTHFSWRMLARAFTYCEATRCCTFQLVPLGKTQQMSGKELYKQMTEEADALRKEKKRSTYPGIYKYLYLLKDKTLYPYLRDQSKLVISFPPMTNSDGTRISEETRDIFAEVTGNNLPFCKKVMDALLGESLQLGLGSEDPVPTDPASVGEGTCLKLQVEKVKVVDKDGNLRVVYPSKTDLVCPGVSVEQRPD